MNRAAILLVIVSVGSVTAFACGSSAPSDPVNTGDANSGADASFGGDGGVVPPPEYPDSAVDARPRDGGDTNDALPDGGVATCGANVQDDPSNCGTCGHSCLGGKCSAGKCGAVALADSGGFAIVASPKEVFWLAESNMYKCAIPGGCNKSPTGLLNAPPYQFSAGHALAFEPTRDTLFFSGRFATSGLDHVESMRTDGSSQTFFYYSFPGVPSPVAADSTQYYFDGPTVAGTPQRIMQQASGTSPSTVLSSFVPNVLTVDSNYVYAANGGTVRAFPKTGGAGRDVVVDNASVVLSIASDGTDIYAGTSTGLIFKCSISGGTLPSGCSPATPWASGQGAVGGIVVDSSYVYWLAPNNAGIARCVLGSNTCSSPTIHVSGLSADIPVALAQDASALYWVTGSTVMMVAK